MVSSAASPNGRIRCLTFEIRPDSDAFRVSPLTLLISPSRYCAGVRDRDAMSLTSSRLAIEYGSSGRDSKLPNSVSLTSVVTIRLRPNSTTFGLPSSSSSGTP
jgi:hypothetical protein